jgi:hypothetical protein
MQKMEIPYGALDSIELLAKQIVEGFLIGLHKSPFHGFSVEFAEHRLYNDGESIKHIDWKVFGRTDKMFVKKYEEETNLRCQVILDISGSMYFPVEKEQLNKLQIACLTSSCIQYLVKKQRDAFGLCTFATDIEKYFPAKASANQQSIMAHELESLYRVVRQFNVELPNQPDAPETKIFSIKIFPPNYFIFLLFLGVPLRGLGACQFFYYLRPRFQCNNLAYLKAITVQTLLL